VLYRADGGDSWVATDYEAFTDAHRAAKGDNRAALVELVARRRWLEVENGTPVRVVGDYDGVLVVNLKGGRTRGKTVYVGPANVQFD
jgi:hypothetical protein